MIENAHDLNNILTQEEIDALLSSEEPQNKSPTQLVKTNQGMKPMPELEKYVDSFSRHVTTTFRNMTDGENIAIKVQAFIKGQMGAYLDSLEHPSLLGFFHLPEWNEEGLVSIDANLAYSVIDMTLGGRRGTSAMQLEGRSYTRIEQDIIKRLFMDMMGDLARAFQVDFLFDGLDTNPQTALIAPPACEMMIARLDVKLDKRGGRMDLVLPAYLLHKMKVDELYEAEEQAETITPFTSQMAHAFLKVPMELKAVLDKKTIPLKSVFNWKKGDTLPLSYFEDKPIQVLCGDITLFKGKIMVSGKQVAIAVEKSLMEEE